MVDCGSYFVTIYNKRKLYEEEKRKRKLRKNNLKELIKLKTKERKTKMTRKLYNSFQNQFEETEREWFINTKAFGLAVKNKTK